MAKQPAPRMGVSPIITASEPVKYSFSKPRHDARFRVPVLDVIAAGGGADKLTSRCAGTPRD